MKSIKGTISYSYRRGQAYVVACIELSIANKLEVLYMFTNRSPYSFFETKVKYFQGRSNVKKFNVSKSF